MVIGEFDGVRHKVVGIEAWAGMTAFNGQYMSIGPISEGRVNRRLVTTGSALSLPLVFGRVGSRYPISGSSQ